MMWGPMVERTLQLWEQSEGWSVGVWRRWVSGLDNKLSHIFTASGGGGFSVERVRPSSSNTCTRHNTLCKIQSLVRTNVYRKQKDCDINQRLIWFVSYANSTHGAIYIDLAASINLLHPKKSNTLRRCCCSPSLALLSSETHTSPILTHELPNVGK